MFWLIELTFVVLGKFYADSWRIQTRCDPVSNLHSWPRTASIFWPFVLGVNFSDKKGINALGRPTAECVPGKLAFSQQPRSPSHWVFFANAKMGKWIFVGHFWWSLMCHGKTFIHPIRLARPCGLCPIFVPSREQTPFKQLVIQFRGLMNERDGRHEDEGTQWHFA